MASSASFSRWIADASTSPPLSYRIQRITAAAVARSSQSRALLQPSSCRSAFVASVSLPTWAITGSRSSLIRLSFRFAAFLRQPTISKDSRFI